MDNEHLMETAEVLAALGHPNRLQLMFLISFDPRSVGELAERTGMSTANTSQHLQKLKAAKLVKVLGRGQERWYETGPAAALPFAVAAVHGLLENPKKRSA